MIAGLHWTAWLLLACAVGIGLAIEVHFYLKHRHVEKPGAQDTPAAGTDRQ